MKKMLMIALAGMFSSTFSASAWAQTAPARPATVASAPVQTTAQRRTTLENKLKSGNKAQVDQAYAGYKAWMAEDGKVGENNFWYARDLFAPLVERAAETMGLIGVARAFKVEFLPNDLGYLDVMEGQCLYQLGRDQEGLAKIEGALEKDPVAAAEHLRAIK